MLFLDSWHNYLAKQLQLIRSADKIELERSQSSLVVIKICKHGNNYNPKEEGLRLNNQLSVLRSFSVNHSERSMSQRVVQSGGNLTYQSGLMMNQLLKSILSLIILVVGETQRRKLQTCLRRYRWYVSQL